MGGPSGAGPWRCKVFGRGKVARPDPHGRAIRPGCRATTGAYFSGPASGFCNAVTWSMSRRVQGRHVGRRRLRFSVRPCGSARPDWRSSGRGVTSACGGRLNQSTEPAAAKTHWFVPTASSRPTSPRNGGLSGRPPRSLGTISVEVVLHFERRHGGKLVAWRLVSAAPHGP